MIDKAIGKITVRSIDGAPAEYYQFSGEVSNGAYDSFHTRMGDGFLGSMVSQLDSGLPLLDVHDSKRVLGKSEKAERSGEGVTATFGMLRDTDTTPPEMRIDEHIRRVEEGLYGGLSIGFRDATVKCDLCGHDPFKRSECEHWLGMEYDGKTATATIEKAELVEVSITPIPSNPNARILSRSDVSKEIADFKDGLEKLDKADSDYQKYRQGLIDKCLEEGQRADKEFDKDVWAKHLQDADIDVIKAFTGVFTRSGDNQWSGGRITRDTEKPKHNYNSIYQ